MTTRTFTAHPWRLAAPATVALTLLLAALPHETVPKQLLGVWKSRAGQDLLRIEPDQVTVATDGHLSKEAVLGFGAGRLYLRSGLVEIWSVALSQQGLLHVLRGSRSSDYERLTAEPPELTLRPCQLAIPGPVSPQRRSDLQTELRARVKEDQAVRRPPIDQTKLAAADDANGAYIRRLAGQLGWIDVERFGLQASGDAFLLLQHSRDLSLQLAVLPFVERDTEKHHDFGSAYALLFDRTQVNLGRKQRYGSQLDTDASGNPVVLPLEDPAHVDALRAELGLPPLKDYLDMISKAIPRSRPIRIAGDEDLAASDSAAPAASQALR
jgi:hypothetical protein